MTAPEDTVVAKLEWYRCGGEVSQRQWADVIGILRAAQAIHEARREGLFVSAFDLRLPRLGPLTFASPAAPDAYTTHDVPAGSWAIAHMAGRYALACEEDPGMTPERFMRQMGLRIVR